jgi:subtilisin family serine protease
MFRRFRRNPGDRITPLQRPRPGTRARILASVPECLESRTLLSTIPPAQRQRPLDVSPAWFAELEPAAILAEQTDSLEWNGLIVKAVPDQWIVQLSARGLESASSVAAAAALLSESPFPLRVNRGLGMAGSLLVTAPGVPPAALGSWLGGLVSVAYFEPNLVRSIDVTPNDSLFGQLWGMHNIGQSGGTIDADIDAPEAWDLETGSASVVVGIIDTGINLTHPDLVANLWTNPGEIAGNSIDDDGNGFVDDVHGYDFINNDASPLDDNGHGTHVAGTVGAVGNNTTGVAGVNWVTSMIALKMMNASGNGPLSAQLAAINYTTMMRDDYGINIVATNNSYGATGFVESEYEAIEANGATGMLFAAAAGNSATDNDNDPENRLYPASYDLASIVAVAATNRNDLLAGFSSYGATMVDLAAPGAGILSTVPGGGYATFSGTSMATPHVAGAIALAWSFAPGATTSAIRQALFDSVDVLPSLNGKVATDGRLNVRRMLELLEPDDPPARPDLASLSDTGSSATDNLTRLDNRNAGNALRFSIGGVQPGATVTLYIDGIATGSAVASGSTVEILTNGSRDLADGPHTVTARQTPSGGAESDDSPPLSIGVDTQIAADIIDVTPDPRETGVNAISIAFGETISGLNIDDLSLTRDGLFVPFGVTSLTSSDQATWTLAGLSTLTQTLATYRLTLHASGSGITDAAGNGLPAGVSEFFQVVTELRADGVGTLVNATTAGTQANTSISRWASGNFVVAWETLPGTGGATGSYARVFSSSGLPLTGQFPLNQATSPVSGVAMLPKVAVTPSGGFVAVWTGGSAGDAHGVFLQRFSATGARIGAEQRVNATTTGAQGDAAITVDSASRIAVFWSSQNQDGSGQGVYGRIFNASGNPLGGEFLVNSTTANDQATPSAAFGPAGDLFVAWQSNGQDGDGWGVYGRRFDPLGAPLGAEFRINSATAQHQLQPVVSRDAEGRAFVAWTSGGATPGSERDVYIRRYDSSGAPLGPAVRVNSTLAGDQSAPALAVQAGGSFLLAWQSQGQDGDSWGIYAQRFDAAGSAVDQELRVSTRAAGAQKTPAASSDGSGKYAFSWDGSGPSDGSGIFFQRFEEIPQEIEISIADAAVVEGQFSPPRMVFTLTLSEAPFEPVTVSWSTRNGTATSPADYAATSGVVTFAPDQTTATITIPLVNDRLDEVNETFSVELSNPTGATIGDAIAIGTIIDDDAPPTLFVVDDWISEGNVGTRIFRSRVLLNTASAQDVSFDYQTIAVTAQAGTDYTPISGRLTIPAGTTTAFLDIPVLCDTVLEPDETLILRISNPLFATIRDPEGVGTIVNDETRIVISDVSQAEGNSGTTLFVFNVTLQAPAPFEVSVNYQTIDGTASAPGDYTARPLTTLTFAPGQTSKTVTVAVVGDGAVEPNETFQVRLTRARNAWVLDGIGLGTIVNDDAISVQTAGQSEGEGDASGIAGTRQEQLVDEAIDGWQTAEISSGRAVRTHAVRFFATSSLQPTPAESEASQPGWRQPRSAWRRRYGPRI